MFWQDDNKTKNLLDGTKYKNLDFYDYKLASYYEYCPDNFDLIKQLCREPNFSEVQSVLYLAMSSLVRQRKFDYYWQEELYKDYEHQGVYDFFIIEKWLECNIMDTIAYYMDDNYIMINFFQLREHHEEIKKAAGRINKKYSNYEVSNKLIKELAEDMSSFYMKKLYSTLQYIRQGIEGLTF